MRGCTVYRQVSFPDGSTDKTGSRRFALAHLRRSLLGRDLRAGRHDYDDEPRVPECHEYGSFSQHVRRQAGIRTVQRVEVGVRVDNRLKCVKIRAIGEDAWITVP